MHSRTSTSASLPTASTPKRLHGSGTRRLPTPGKPPTVRKSLSITEKSDARRRHMEEVRARKKAGESQQQEGKKHCAHPAGVRSTKEARRKVDTEMMQNSSGTPSQLKKHHQQHDSSTPTENLNKSEKLKNSSVHNHREGSDIDTIIQPISPEQTPSTGEQETHSHMLHEIKGEDDVVCKKNLHFQEESFALHNHVQDQQDEQQKSEANRCKENEVMRNEDDTTSSRTETCDSYATSNTLKNHNYESLPRKASGSKFQHFTSIGVDKDLATTISGKSSSIDQSKQSSEGLPRGKSYDSESDDNLMDRNSNSDSDSLDMSHGSLHAFSRGASIRKQLQSSFRRRESEALIHELLPNFEHETSTTSLNLLQSSEKHLKEQQQESVPSFQEKEEKTEDGILNENVPYDMGNLKQQQRGIHFQTGSLSDCEETGMNRSFTKIHASTTDKVSSHQPHRKGDALHEQKTIETPFKKDEVSTVSLNHTETECSSISSTRIPSSAQTEDKPMTLRPSKPSKLSSGSLKSDMYQSSDRNNGIVSDKVVWKKHNINMSKGDGLLGFAIKTKRNSDLPYHLCTGTVKPQGAAIKAGLKTGDVLCRINGQDLRTASKEQVTGLLRRASGSISMTIYRCEHIPQADILLDNTLTSVQSKQKLNSNQQKQSGENNFNKQENSAEPWKNVTVDDFSSLKSDENTTLEAHHLINQVRDDVSTLSSHLQPNLCDESYQPDGTEDSNNQSLTSRKTELLIQQPSLDEQFAEQQKQEAKISLKDEIQSPNESLAHTMKQHNNPLVTLEGEKKSPIHQHVLDASIETADAICSPSPIPHIDVKQTERQSMHVNKENSCKGEKQNEGENKDVEEDDEDFPGFPQDVFDNDKETSYSNQDIAHKSSASFPRELHVPTRYKGPRLEYINQELNRLKEHSKSSHLEAEFSRVARAAVRNTVIAASRDENKQKNRFHNILAYDHSRVCIEPDVDVGIDTDYINANFISDFERNSKCAYIATQTPIPFTRIAFWKMVWDRNVEFIIMLDSDRSCNKDEAQFGEKGPERHVELAEGSTIVQENYELYFPKSLNSIQYGHIVIGLVSCDDRDLFVERVFLLEQGSNRRKLRHIQVKNIPDDGIPNKAALLKVIKHVRGMLRPKSGPILVHCKAGVGWTGVFIAVNWLLEASIYQQSPLDIPSAISSLRHDRMWMVETASQYKFIYELLIDLLGEEKQELEHYLETTAARSQHNKQAWTSETVPLQLLEQRECKETHISDSKLLSRRRSLSLPYGQTRPPSITQEELQHLRQVPIIRWKQREIRFFFAYLDLDFLFPRISTPRKHVTGKVLMEKTHILMARLSEEIPRYHSERLLAGIFALCRPNSRVLFLKDRDEELNKAIGKHNLSLGAMSLSAYLQGNGTAAAVRVSCAAVFSHIDTFMFILEPRSQSTCEDVIAFILSKSHLQTVPCSLFCCTLYSHMDNTSIELKPTVNDLQDAIRRVVQSCGEEELQIRWRFFSYGIVKIASVDVSAISSAFQVIKIPVPPNTTAAVILGVILANTTIIEPVELFSLEVIISSHISGQLKSSFISYTEDVFEALQAHQSCNLRVTRADVTAVGREASMTLETAVKQRNILWADVQRFQNMAKETIESQEKIKAFQSENASLSFEIERRHDYDYLQSKVEEYRGQIQTLTEKLMRQPTNLFKESSSEASGQHVRTAISAEDKKAEAIQANSEKPLDSTSRSSPLESVATMDSSMNIELVSTAAHSSNSNVTIQEKENENLRTKLDEMNELVKYLEDKVDAAYASAHDQLGKERALRESLQEQLTSHAHIDRTASNVALDAIRKSITARDKVIQDLSEHIFELQKQCISKDKDRILSTDATGKNTIETVVEEKLRLVEQCNGLTSLIRELEAQQFQLEEQQLATSLHEKFDSDDQYTNSGAVVPSVREIQEHRTCLSELFHLIQCSTILAVQLVKTEKSLGIALRTTHFGIEPNLLTLLTVKTILEESVAEQAGLAPGDMILQVNDEYVVNLSKKLAAAAIQDATGEIRLVIARIGGHETLQKTLGQVITTENANGPDTAANEDLASLRHSLNEKEREVSSLRARHSKLLQQHDQHLHTLRQLDHERTVIFDKLNAFIQPREQLCQIQSSNLETRERNLGYHDMPIDQKVDFTTAVFEVFSHLQQEAKDADILKKEVAQLQKEIIQQTEQLAFYRNNTILENETQSHHDQPIREKEMTEREPSSMSEIIEKLRLAHATIDALQAENAVLHQQVNHHGGSLKDDASSNKNGRSQYQKDLSETKRRLKEAEAASRASSRQFEKEVNALSEKLSSKESLVAQMRNQITALNEDKSQLQLRTRELENTVELLQENTQDLKSELSLATQSKKQAEEAMKVTVSSLDQSIIAKTKELQRAHARIEELENDAQEWRGTVDTRVADFEKMKEQFIRTRNERVELLEKQLEEQQDRATKQADAIAQISADLQSKNTMIEALEAERDHMLSVMRERLISHDDEKDMDQMVSKPVVGSNELWDKISSKGKNEILRILEDKDEEAERLKYYIDSLMEVIIDKSPEILESVNKLNVSQKEFVGSLRQSHRRSTRTRSKD